MKTKAKSKLCLLRLSRQSAGFSLVEVTIAVAIAALGFLTLLGLLPQESTWPAIQQKCPWAPKSC